MTLASRLPRRLRNKLEAVCLQSNNPSLRYKDLRSILGPSIIDI
jgi:hypothetical protein